MLLYEYRIRFRRHLTVSCVYFYSIEVSSVALHSPTSLYTVNILSISSEARMRFPNVGFSVAISQGTKALVCIKDLDWWNSFVALLLNRSV